MSGLSVSLEEVPPEARLLVPKRPCPPVDDVPAGIERALAEPVEGEPLEALVTPGMRVAVVLADFVEPAPLAQRDVRRDMLEAVRALFERRGLAADQVSVVVANGLSRKWRPAELTERLGSAEGVTCHDAEAPESLVELEGWEPGAAELSRTVVEADLVVHLNVMTTPHGGALDGMVGGVAGYRTARLLNAPELFEQPSPRLDGSEYRARHRSLAGLLQRRTRVVQLTAVLDNRLWGTAIEVLLRSQEAGLGRPVNVWNVLPMAVRERAARLVRAAYRPISFHFGAPDAVAARALPTFEDQHEVAIDRPARMLVFGLPGMGPFSVGASENPILASHLALAHLSELHTAAPLLEQGGVIVFANPLTPSFDGKVHAPHEELYEKVLRLTRDPAEIHERYEPYFAGRPELVSAYRSRYAFHGTHPLYAWYRCTPARRTAGRIIVAHGDPRSCSRLGFTPARDLTEALERARDFLGEARPSTLMLQLPPTFWVRVGATAA